jgi:hypothetical protein
MPSHPERVRRNYRMGWWEDPPPPEYVRPSFVMVIGYAVVIAAAVYMQGCPQ